MTPGRPAGPPRGAARTPTFPLLVASALAAAVGTLWFVGQLWAPRGPAWPGWILALVSGCCGALASWRVGHVPGGSGPESPWPWES